MNNTPHWCMFGADGRTQRTSPLATRCGYCFIVNVYFVFGGRYWSHRMRMPVDEISLGDYVLCGGEVAVLAIMEAVARLIPGVLGNAQSAQQDSFAEAVGGLLEAPAYTKPAVWRGMAVPEVLLSGHHARIEQWRAEQSRLRSAQRRPDLL